MPFYFRRSVSAGPFRFNFSSGGLGMSVGVRGLRIGTGPRGHYVQAGRGGFVYRHSLGRAGSRPVAAPVPVPADASLSDGMVAITSGDVLAMSDARLQDLLTELNAKQQQAKLSMMLALLGSLIALVALASIGGAATPVIILIVIGWGIWPLVGCVQANGGAVL